MKILTNSQVTGDFVRLETNRSQHIQDNQKTASNKPPLPGQFAQLFNNALEEVNHLELKASEITNQFIVDPESVNIHDVQIAAEQAEMAVLFTKSVVDKVIRAYKEVINLR